MASATFVVYQRADRLWGWRLVSGNNVDIIATDGGQGYNNRADADSMGRRVLSGEFAVQG